MTQPRAEGRGAQQAMRAALGTRRASARDRLHHAHGTRHRTATWPRPSGEAVLGEHAKKLVFGSTKSMTGHQLGAAGGVEFAVCALVLERG